MPSAPLSMPSLRTCPVSRPFRKRPRLQLLITLPFPVQLQARVQHRHRNPLPSSAFAQATPVGPEPLRNASFSKAGVRRTRLHCMAIGLPESSFRNARPGAYLERQNFHDAHLTPRSHREDKSQELSPEAAPMARTPCSGRVAKQSSNRDAAVECIVSPR